jgi:hypothetical protein
MAAFTPAVAAPPAATSLTVDELDRLLAQMHERGDGKTARQLAGLKLTERASAAQLARWEAGLPGSHAREALIALADASAFLHPPASELLSSPPPDAAAAKQIVAHMIEFVKGTLPKLPNFYALRSTTAFELTTEDQLRSQQIVSDVLRPQHLKRSSYHKLGPAKSSGSPDMQLFWTGSSAQVVTYRGGSEVADSFAGGANRAPPTLFTLTTSGEFGSILRMVLEDASPDKTVWDHWEEGSSGPLAVFRYSVPSERSHFAVEITTDNQPEFPAYHGELAVDPASGAIFRITIVANGSGSGFFDESSILVEFGPVPIGGMTYIRPVRTFAIAKFFDSNADLDAQPPPVPFRTSINDVSFTNYHVFRTNARIVPGTEKP